MNQRTPNVSDLPEVTNFMTVSIIPGCSAMHPHPIWKRFAFVASVKEGRLTGRWEFWSSTGPDGGHAHSPHGKSFPKTMWRTLIFFFFNRHGLLLVATGVDDLHAWRWCPCRVSSPAQILVSLRQVWSLVDANVKGKHNPNKSFPYSGKIGIGDFYNLLTSLLKPL